MTPTDTPAVLARIYPSQPRRWFGMISLVGAGALMLAVAFLHPPETLGWRIFLMLTGGVMLWGALEAWNATARGIELTEAELRDTSGRTLCEVADIRSVSSDALAFKPSSGFLVRLSSRQRFAWAPGLWWRMGRSVGVGGMTSATEAKYMAEVIRTLLAKRTGDTAR